MNKLKTSDIPPETLKEIKQFLLKTSIPRLIAEQRKTNND